MSVMAMYMMMNMNNRGGGGFRSSHRQDDNKPSNIAEIVKVNRKTVDMILLLLIAIMAAVVGSEWEERFLISVCLIPFLSGLVTVMTLTIFERKTFERRLATLATLLLLATSVFALILPPEHRVPTRVCPAIALALAFPYLAIAKTSGSKMRILIVLLLVLLPIFVSIIFRSLSQELRAILLLPALNLLFHDAKSKTELAIDRATAVICASVQISSMEMNFGEQDSMDWSKINGFALAVANGICFNASLVELNWETPASVVDKQLKKNIFMLMITVVVLMGASVWLLGLMLDHGGVELIPILLMTCLYFAFVYLHEKIRSSITLVYIFPILLGTFAATIYAAYLSLPFFGRAAKDVVEQRRNEKYMAFIALMHLSLLFTYFMMTALSKTENRTIQALRSREVENVVAAPAAAAVTSSLPAAGPKYISMPVQKPCVVIEMPRRDSEHPKHATLLMAAAMMTMTMMHSSSSSSRLRSEPDPDYVFLTESSVAQSILLAITVTWAALTGCFAVHFNIDDRRLFIDFVRLAMLMVAALLSVLTLVVLGDAKVLKISFFISSTVLLILTATLSISTDVPELWPISSSQLINLPCAAIAIAICLPYMIMCLKQDQVRAAIATLIVLPSLILANLAMMWSVEVRCVLLVPALTVMAYHATVRVCSSCEWALIKTLLRSSGAVILVGASVAATAVAHSMKHSKVSYASGFIVIAGGIAFNCCLMITRFEHRSQSVSDSMKLWKRLLVMAEIFLLNSLALIGIYTCLAHSTALILIIPLSILLVCNLCALIFLHDPVYESTPTWLYFLMLLGTALSSKALWFRVSYLPYWRGVGDQLLPGSTEWSLFHSILTLDCSLIFVYLMMSVLAKIDIQSRKASKVTESTALVNTPETRTGAASTSVVKEQKLHAKAEQKAVDESAKGMGKMGSDDAESCEETKPSHVALDVPD